MNDAARLQHLASRMAHIEAFEVMEIQTLARQVEARGRDVIHLEIGEPDFTTPRPIVEAAQRALESKPMFYTSALGLAELRAAIAAFYRDRYKVAVDPSRVIVTSGSSAALLLTFGVLLEAGDEVLLTDPSYPCNRHFVRTLGGVPKLIPVGPATRYQLNARLVEDHWSSHTRIAMVATPSNPTGTMVTAEETRAMAEVVRRKGGFLLMDEIYHGLTYGFDAPTAAAAGEDVFVVNSFSKYFQMTGWRLGWLVAPPNYVREIEKLAQNLFISPSTVAQHAALACFDPAAIAIVEERRAELDRRRRFLIPALQSIGIKVPVEPQGAFYVYADISGVAPDSFAFARDLLTQAGVALTPGKDFGHNEPERHIRIAYTQTVPRLEQAIERMRKFIAKA